MGKKIFSGVQPTGNLHLGNYLGAIKNFVRLNNENSNKCIFCVVDLHAITTKQNPTQLKKNIFWCSAYRQSSFRKLFRSHKKFCRLK